MHEVDSEIDRLKREKNELDSINNCKKFFYDINLEEELNNDIDSDELELLSDDEIQEDTSHLLGENHTNISSQHREDIEKNMQFLF